MEKLIAENNLKTEGLKKTTDFVCAEVKDVKQKTHHLEKRVANGEQRLDAAEKRVSELESYSRRWNLRLFGVPETEGLDVRQEVIRICRAVLPEEESKLPVVIDTEHRLGPKKQSALSDPRGIILQFTSRVFPDAVWKAAKKSAFLRDKRLRFAEDLSKADRERRLKLWPMVKEARLQESWHILLGVVRLSMVLRSRSHRRFHEPKPKVNLLLGSFDCFGFAEYF